ncbi:MAG TPA: arsenite methyltransferase [Bacteroidetes bacterium]|nr:arsenite methyltransferase [Bacteroidota bacterium]
MLNDVKEIVKEKYTEVVTKGSGCCGPSCCTPEEIINVGENYDGIEGYEADADLGLGCGIPTEFAKIKEGDTVLDLGAGAGNDVFVARRIVGENGHVIGVDMTEAMIKKANENKHKLGYENVEFILGDIEKLPVADNSIDVAVSNCVMNLVPNKPLAYAEVYRSLKPGAHFSISDIVLNGKLPEGIINAAEMYAGCVSGALEKSEYLRVIKEAGFKNIEVAKERQIVLPDELLLEHIRPEELSVYKKRNGVILSITVYAEK